MHSYECVRLDVDQTVCVVCFQMTCFALQKLHRYVCAALHMSCFASASLSPSEQTARKGGA